ncbi:unnamed protein product [Rhizophagus irregularis]|nr:unnamed protein product [Rhizophagus irregularis]
MKKLDLTSIWPSWISSLDENSSSSTIYTDENSSSSTIYTDEDSSSSTVYTMNILHRQQYIYGVHVILIVTSVTSRQISDYFQEAISNSTTKMTRHVNCAIPLW